MQISLCFYNTDKVLKLKRKLSRNKINYNYIEEQATLIIYNLDEFRCDFSKNCTSFGIDLYNKEYKFIHIEIQKSDICDIEIERR